MVVCYSLNENRAILAPFKCTSLSIAYETESAIFDIAYT